MYKGHKIGVVIPAYNEELLILETLGGVPDYVDAMFVINDCSKDNTLQLIREQQKKDVRVHIINHEVNRGLGQSLINGYVASKESDIDITAVMAGDNQMDPNDLPTLLDSIIERNFDYVKGNRLLHHEVGSMPTYRFLGNSALTILTKFATGYYFSMDPQCGYTAIKNTALKRIPIEQMTKGYGYNADILCMLNIQGFAVEDAEVRPVYDREKSKIVLWKYVFKTSWILINLFLKRLVRRYIVLDFHPLVLFYMFSVLTFVGIFIPMLVRWLYMLSTTNEFPKTTSMILVFSLLISFQSLLFAIWMDMDYNKKKRTNK